MKKKRKFSEFSNYFSNYTGRNISYNNIIEDYEYKENKTWFKIDPMKDSKKLNYDEKLEMNKKKLEIREYFLKELFKCKNLIYKRFH